MLCKPLVTNTKITWEIRPAFLREDSTKGLKLIISNNMTATIIRGVEADTKIEAAVAGTKIEGVAEGTKTEVVVDPTGETKEGIELNN